jgi:hypothetical protein
MSLRYSYHQAAKIVRQWPFENRPSLARLCGRIQDAERELNTAAALRLKGCLEGCRGLCCRNLQLDAVFGVPDFVYVLTLEPSLEATIEECTRHEDPLFTSNCLFLENGIGPCLFPPDVRPEVCITSFCRGDEALKPEIRRVKTGFWKLGVLLCFRRVPLVQRLLLKIG